MNGRVILAGNNLAAIYTLDVLLEALVPDRLLVIAPPGGRLHDWQASLAARAEKAGVEHLAPEDVNAPAVLARAAAHRAGLLLSVYYSQIFGGRWFEAVLGPMLNFHPSLLPRHRGTAPLIWAIIEGDPITGLTVHHIDRGVDTGPILTQHVLPITPEDTGHSLHLKMAALVRAAAVELLRDFLAGRSIPAGRPQTGPGSHHRRGERVNHLVWSAPRERIRNIVRALAPPLPGAYALFRGEPLVLARVAAADAIGTGGARPPGTLAVIPGESPLVWASDGPLRIDRFVHGGEVCPGEALARRRGVRDGDVLS